MGTALIGLFRCRFSRLSCQVHSWNGASKLFNANKYVKCISLVQGKLYCGCHDSSIQELDLATGTLSNIQNGSRKLLGKSNPVQAVQLQGGLLYTVSSPIDGAAVKVTCNLKQIYILC